MQQKSRKGKSDRDDCPPAARINACRAPSATSSGHDGKIYTSTSGHCVKKSSPNEINFYTTLDAYPPGGAVAALLTVMPTFFGTCQGHVIMENIKHGMSEPIELAIKLGKYTSDINDLLSSGMGTLQAAAKTIKMRVADALTTSRTHNFRVTGANFLPHPGLPNVVSRHQLARADPVSVLNAFFSRGNAHTRRSALAGVHRVRKVLADVSGLPSGLEAE